MGAGERGGEGARGTKGGRTWAQRPGSRLKRAAASSTRSIPARLPARPQPPAHLRPVATITSGRVAAATCEGEGAGGCGADGRRLWGRHEAVLGPSRLAPGPRPLAQGPWPQGAWPLAQGAWPNPNSKPQTPIPRHEGKAQGPGQKGGPHVWVYLWHGVGAGEDHGVARHCQQHLRGEEVAGAEAQEHVRALHGLRGVGGRFGEVWGVFGG